MTAGQPAKPEVIINGAVDFKRAKLTRLKALALALFENRTVLFLVSNRMLQIFQRRPSPSAFGPRDHLQKLASRLGVSLRRRSEHGSKEDLHRRYRSPSCTVIGRVASSKAMAPKRSAIPPPNALKPATVFSWSPFRIAGLALLKLVRDTGLAILAGPNAAVFGRWHGTTSLFGHNFPCY